MAIEVLQRQLISSTSADSFPQSVVVADFDRDKRTDLVTATLGTSNIAVLYRYGNGTFGKLQTYATDGGSNSANINVGHFNNDDQLNIIIGDETANNVAIFFLIITMENLPVYLGESLVAYVIALSHFNNDSRLDFAIENNGKQNIGAFLASGNKPFGAQTTFFLIEVLVPHQWLLIISTMAVTSILLSLTLAPTILIYLSNIEIEYFQTLQNIRLVIILNQCLLAVGDLNGDYELDIAVANFSANNVCISYGFGN